MDLALVMSVFISVMASLSMPLGKAAALLVRIQINALKSLVYQDAGSAMYTTIVVSISGILGFHFLHKKEYHPL
jgi:hypothetical protein